MKKRPDHGGYPDPDPDPDPYSEVTILLRKLAREIRSFNGVERTPSFLRTQVLNYAPKRPISYMKHLLSERELLEDFATFLNDREVPSTEDLCRKYPMIAELLG